MKMSAANLVAAVIQGTALKPDVSVVDAARNASRAAGTEAYWLGNSAEEKARISSWLQADLSNDNLLVADLEKALESSSFAGIPAHETAADLFLYSVLSTKTFADDFQQKNPNVARWLNHMQTFVARATGNPQLHKFRVAGLRASVQAEAPAPTAAPAAANEKSKKEEKAEKKDEKKEEKAQKKEAKKEGAVAAAPAEGAPGAEKKEKKGKEEAAPKAAGAEETEPKKKKAAAAAPKAEAKEESEFVPNLLDVRVGKILTAKQFTEKLYMEEIDVGEDKPRVVCSGLVQYYASADMLVGKNVLVVCNLKPRKMADGESNGMVLAASSPDKSTVKLVEPPAEAKPGDHVAYTEAPPTPAEFAEPNKVAKKKILESVMDGWVTDAEGRVGFKSDDKIHIMNIGGKPVIGGGIQNGKVG